jgi:predicted transcriptional regulator
VAFLYLKVEDTGENYSDIEPVFKPKHRLKIGTFKVELNSYKLVTEVISDSVEDLWKQTSRHAGINRELFFNYFQGRDVGHAIAIGSVWKNPAPLELGATFGIRAPQSLVYV